MCEEDLYGSISHGLCSIKKLLKSLLNNITSYAKMLLDKREGFCVVCSLLL